VKPDGRIAERSTGAVKVVARENMLAALRRVESNKGAPGSDGMTVEDLRDHLKVNWPAIKTSLISDAYKPQPVRRVEIPKPDGGVRLLGIPNVVDRLIQQAILQVLTPILDPTFSESSFGFRPKRGAHGAVRRAREYIDEGYRWVVDLDLAKFFDEVNRDKLMVRIWRRVKDNRVLHLIRRYLQSGLMLNGVAIASEKGTPQGVRSRRCSETSCSTTSIACSMIEVIASVATLTTATFMCGANGRENALCAASGNSSKIA
jgi:RNA-directed DNA polymerase